MGVHQKIDRVARKHLGSLLSTDDYFPNIKEILHFEGKNGPDGIKSKSPAVDEPWHFVNPDDVDDLNLVNMIEEHLNNLADALRDKNEHRAAFEAAWMAHAVTDGLTPAHHFALELALKELRGGQGIDTRTSILKKGMMTGKTPVERLRNNWRFWGAKGIMTMHFSFEAGVASAVSYQRFMDGLPTAEDIEKVKKIGYRQYFINSVKYVASLNMYTKYAKSGWTRSLIKQTNQELLPTIIKTVVIGWLVASWKAKETKVE